MNSIINKPKYICFTGYKGVGKDTAANYVVNKYNLKTEKIAGPIKDMIKFLFEMNDSDLEENKEKINEYWNISPRILMQFLGTDIFQYELQKIMPNIGRNFWIKKLIKKTESNSQVVISDLRFQHEFNELKNMDPNILVIRLINRNIDKVDKHVSEKDGESIQENFKIYNEGTKDELYRALDDILNIIL